MALARLIDKNSISGDQDFSHFKAAHQKKVKKDSASDFDYEMSQMHRSAHRSNSIQTQGQRALGESSHRVKENRVGDSRLSSRQDHSRSGHPHGGSKTVRAGENRHHLSQAKELERSNSEQSDSSSTQPLDSESAEMLELVNRYLSEGDQAEILEFRGGEALLGEALPVEEAPSAQTLSGGEFLNTFALVKGGALGQHSQGEGYGSESQPQGFDFEGIQSLKDSLKKIDRFSEVESQTQLGEKDPISSQILVPNLLAQPLGANSLAGKTGVVQTVVAQVTTDSRGSSEVSASSLGGISQGLKLLSARGGGELQIRLNPEHLGNLVVRVVTDGNQVGLKFMASDEKARKVLEDSLSSLKESMASQNLNVGQVDFMVSNSDSNFDQRGMQNQSAPYEGAWQNMSQNQHQSQGHSGGWGRFAEEQMGWGANKPRSHSGGPSSLPGLAARTQNTQSQRRLDVMG